MGDFWICTCLPFARILAPPPTLYLGFGPPRPTHMFISLVESILVTLPREVTEGVELGDMFWCVWSFLPSGGATYSLVLQQVFGIKEWQHYLPCLSWRTFARQSYLFCSCANFDFEIYCNMTSMWAEWLKWSLKLVLWNWFFIIHDQFWSNIKHVTTPTNMSYIMVANTSP